MNLIITTEARQDIVAAYGWYEEQKQDLGERFLNQFRITCNAILIAPEAYQSFDRYRQIPMDVFPYIVLYELFDQDVVVFAVFNTYRHPLKKKRRKN